jgi:YD repeat-containing protein/VCBS repeat-containing protein
MYYASIRRTPTCISAIAQVVVALFLILSSIAPGKSGNDIIYVYDELGRLIAVIDPAGDTATYAYDAVGNVLSISRYSSSVVSLIEFTPNSGPVGATVTIYGTGFSTTPSQNTVTFNGVTASVTSASFSQLVTTVPNGATTGTISVTTPTGSAASADSFIVGDPGAPTITSFTPSIGLAGTAVTVTGTNFDTTAYNNRTKLNATVASVSSATATSLGTSVPTSTGSGRISVETFAGTATSTADFFVPPSPYTAADVLVTDRMALGDSRTVALGTSGKIGLVVFDATEGQRVSLKVNTSTISGGSITIFKPNGTSLASGTFSLSGGFISSPLLSTTGTYTILVDPSGTSTGNLNFTLNNASDVLTTIASGGLSQTVNITVQGQNARLTFSGTAGQRISVGLTSVTIGTLSCCNAAVSITAINGIPVLAPSGFGTAGFGSNTLTLPHSGMYEILVDPNTTFTGSTTVTLSDELTGSMSINGSAQTLTFRAGQNARLTFSGSTGQRVTLGTTGVTIGAPFCCDVATASIIKPDGTALMSSFGFKTGGDGSATNVLPVSGTYLLTIDPGGGRSGDGTFNLSEDLSGSIAINGSTLPLTISRFGQNAWISFDGTTGLRVSLGMSGMTIGASYCCDSATLAIYKPDGTTLLSSFPFDESGEGTPTVILPVTGTYHIAVDPGLSFTGDVTLTLSEDISNSLTINGSTLPLSFSRAGQNGWISFDGTAGQRVSLGLSGMTIGASYCCDSANVTIYKPDGATLLSSFPFDESGEGTPTVILPVTGTYHIAINPILAFTGNVTLTLSEDLFGSLTINGSTLPLSFSRAGQNGWITFDGTAGQRVSLGMSGVTIGTGYCCDTAKVIIYKPDGTTLLSSFAFKPSGKGAPTVNLPVTGTYSIAINPILAFTGDATFTLSEDVAASITINGSSVPISLNRVGQNAVVTFSGTASQLVTVRITGNSLGSTTVKLLNPDGTQLTATTSSSAAFNLAQKTLGTTSTYSITVDPGTITAGNITISVTCP